MTNSNQASPNHRGQLISLVVLASLICVPIVVGWLNHEPDPPADLCDMLKSGWTGEEIISSDQWRTWPDSMSRTERTSVVLREAGRECPRLVGL
jgi:hypothetical protein